MLRIVGYILFAFSTAVSAYLIAKGALYALVYPLAISLSFYTVLFGKNRNNQTLLIRTVLITLLIASIVVGIIVLN